MREREVKKNRKQFIKSVFCLTLCWTKAEKYKMNNTLLQENDAFEYSLSRYYETQSLNDIKFASYNL